ncbi:MAG TPA: sortase, partial [Anaerolineae bacterium]|nr:sortase [Anaerolineae bacterium]
MRILGTFLVVIVLAGSTMALSGCTAWPLEQTQTLQQPTAAPAAAAKAAPSPSSPMTLPIILLVTATPGSKSATAPEAAVLPTRVEATPEPTYISTVVPVEPEPEPTSTPVSVEPTVEPTAEPTPAPVPAEPDPEPTLPTQPLEYSTGEVSAPALNVRQGPGTTFAAIGVVRRGHQFTILDSNPAGSWFHVCCVEGKEGWVSASEMQPSSAGDAINEGGAGSEPASGSSLPEPEPSAPPTPAAPSSSLVRIAIPDLGIDAPTVEVGWVEVEVDGKRQVQWEVADYAAGYHVGSAQPGQAGNAVISGHHNIKGKVFKNISLAWNDAYAELLADGITMRSDALDGRSIYLYNVEGQQFQYVIEGLYKMPDRNVSEEQRKENARFMAPTSEPTLTLITCWPYTT